jgi:hypothetical protein
MEQMPGEFGMQWKLVIPGNGCGAVRQSRGDNQSLIRGQYWYFPQTTNDLKTCAGPGGSPSCADMLGTIGSFLLAPGGWVASCAEQSAQCSGRRASCADVDSVFEELSAAGFHLPEAGLAPALMPPRGKVRQNAVPSLCLGQIAFTRLFSLLQACLLAWFGLVRRFGHA